ncbi:HAMP domain-containing protein, partial [candidate division GN15 bacterium]|nr:HAMP domain-containing protein [candidate division GN15 bacterium]
MGRGTLPRGGETATDQRTRRDSHVTLKIKAKLIGAFGVAAAICAVVGLIGYYGISQTRGSIEEIADVRLPSVENLLIIEGAAQRIDGAIKSLSDPTLTNEEVEATMAGISEARDRYEKAWEIYEPLPQTEEEARVWQEFTAAWEAWRVDNNAFMDMRRELEAMAIENPTRLRQQIERFTKDHYALMDEMATSILLGRNFDGQTDHTKCAFGKWMAGFKTENPEIHAALEEIRNHHRAFHENLGKAGSIMNSRGSAGSQQATAIYRDEIVPTADKTFALLNGINEQVARAEELYDRMGTQARTVNAVSAKEAIALLEDLVTINEHVAAESAESGKSIAAGMTTVIWISLILGVAVAMIFGLIIARNISRPVVQISKAAEKIAVGDVDQQIEVTSKDEIGVLGESFRSLIDYIKGLAGAAERIADNDLTVRVEPKSERDVLGHAFKTMVGNLTGMIRQLTDNAGQLVSAANEISSSSEQMSRGAQDQSQQVTQVSTAVEEMTATIVQSSKNAGE